LWRNPEHDTPILFVGPADEHANSPGIGMGSRLRWHARFPRHWVAEVAPDALIIEGRVAVALVVKVDASQDRVLHLPQK
jgi:hypothetical protein